MRYSMIPWLCWTRLRKAGAAPLAAVILAFASAARAADPDLVIEPGPPGPQLFVELYRQAALVLARYDFGLYTRDEEVTPSAHAPLRMEFRAQNRQLRVSLIENGSEIAWDSVAFPGARWSVLGQAGRAMDLAHGLLQSRWIPADRPRARAEDFQRALLPEEWLDPFTEIWIINRLAEAQRGKSPAPYALKRLSAAYAWLGFFTNDLPSARSRLFFARAFALAELCRSLGAPAPSETALALALAGRESDALRLSGGAQDDPALAALARAMATDATAPPSSVVGVAPRALRLAVAWCALRAGRRESVPLLQEAVLDDPLDFWSLARLIELEDEPADRILTAFYVSAVTGWRPALDLLAGQLPDERERLSMEAAAGTWGSALGRARQVAAAAANEEIPAEVRTELLGDFAVDAGLKRAALLAKLGGPESAETQFVERIGLLGKNLPWGFAVEAAVTGPDAGGPSDVPALLAQAPPSYGALREARRYLSAFDLSGLSWRAGAVLDDLAWDWTLRLESGNAGSRAAAENRLEALEPADYEPFAEAADASGSPAQWDAAVARFPATPGLLRRAAAFAESRVPPDRAGFARLLDRMIAADPADPRPRAQKFYYLAEEGPAGQAPAAFDGFPQDADPQARLQLAALSARGALLEGRTEDARGLASALARQDPQDALPILAFLFEQRQRYDLAETVLSSDPSTADGGAMTMFLLRTGDPRARARLNADVGSVPDADLASPASVSLEAERRAADALILEEEWNQAAKVLAAVLASPAGGDDPSAALWLAVCALRAGQPLQTVQSAVQLAADRAGPESRLLPVFDVYLGKSDAAAAQSRLTTDSPTRSLAYFFLAEYLRAKGDPAQAASFYERVRGELFFDSKEYYLSLRALGRVPDPVERFRALAKAVWRDASRVRENWAANKASWTTLLDRDADAGSR